MDQHGLRRDKAVLNVRSITDLNRAIVNNLHRLDRSAFDAVVGIPRSGMLPATLIATHLQKPLGDVDGFCRGWVFKRHDQKIAAARILLVDDSVNKGRAMMSAVQKIKQAVPTAQLTRFAVYGPYQLSDPKLVCDLFCEECHGPRVFQWNMWKHIRLPRWTFDLDGVLCRDPTNEENDDGPKYLKFIRDVEPLFLPTRPIGHIITGRLERYRVETEKWLRRYNVQYLSLHMMPFATKAERMAHGGRGQWKAEVFKTLDSEFFIESNPKQASIIAKAGIQVWCTSTQETIAPS